MPKVKRIDTDRSKTLFVINLSFDRIGTNEPAPGRLTIALAQSTPRRALIDLRKELLKIHEDPENDMLHDVKHIYIDTISQVSALPPKPQILIFEELSLDGGGIICVPPEPPIHAYDWKPNSQRPDDCTVYPFLCWDVCTCREATNNTCSCK
jgi:hypothetical protein